MQAGDPALGALGERGNVSVGQTQPHRFVEECGGFGGRKTQVTGADFEELPPGLCRNFFTPLEVQPRIGGEYRVEIIAGTPSIVLAIFGLIFPILKALFPRLRRLRPAARV